MAPQKNRLCGKKKVSCQADELFPLIRDYLIDYTQGELTKQDRFLFANRWVLIYGMNGNLGVKNYHSLMICSPPAPDKDQMIKIIKDAYEAFLDHFEEWLLTYCGCGMKVDRIEETCGDPGVYDLQVVLKKLRLQKELDFLIGVN